MAEIFITGHKNPDLDSTCSSYCYAHLKNKIDPENIYIPVRCGSLNKQTKAVFRNLRLKPPLMVKDVYPRVKDIARRDNLKLDINEPVLLAVREIDELNVSVIPVFENENSFKGILSVHEITQFFISENSGKRPVYLFRVMNFEKVLPGRFYRRGNTLEFEAPIMTGAMPIGTSMSRLNGLLPEKPILIVGLRRDILEYAVQRQLPAIILTGISSKSSVDFDFSSYQGHVFISETDTAETIRLLRLSTPIKNIVNCHPKIIQSDDHYDDAKTELVNSFYRGLPVFSDKTFAGIVTRRCFIEKPKRQIILMDHNETAQSIPGAEHAEVLEILDHHRLAPEKTHQPIYVFNKPVGSTCTIVYHHFKIHDVPVTKKLAMLLLSGILSDTVLLKSPTATDEDRRTVDILARKAGIDYRDYGREMFSQTAILNQSEPKPLIKSDFKTYQEFGFSIGIGQVEVVTLEDVDESRQKYLQAIEEIRKESNFNWVLLLITNVLKENSMLLSSDFPRGEKALIYKPVSPHLFDLPGVLSRKKQLLPEILRVLEDISS